jgi:hypothetical protein
MRASVMASAAATSRFSDRLSGACCHLFKDRGCLAGFAFEQHESPFNIPFPERIPGRFWMCRSQFCAGPGKLARLRKQTGQPQARGHGTRIRARERFEYFNRSAGLPRCIKTLREREMRFGERLRQLCQLVVNGQRFGPATRRRKDVRLEQRSSRRSIRRQRPDLAQSIVESTYSEQRFAKQQR